MVKFPKPVELLSSPNVTVMSWKCHTTFSLLCLPPEATAAADAGLKTCIVVREDIVLTDEEKKKFNTISSFTELLTDAVDGETPAKKVEKEVEPEPEAVTA